jgi:poly(3-hydroxybutyrate) depolymerase
MKILCKQLQTPDLVRSMFLALPESDPKALWKSSAITILREDSDAVSVERIIADFELAKLVDEQKCILIFPNPVDREWNFELTADQPRDAEFVNAINQSLNSGDYLEGWRVINDVHYLLGFGTGASLVNTLVAAFPSGLLAAAICTVGGVMSDAALQRAVNAPVPALVVGGDPKAVAYLIAANQAEPTGEAGHFACPYNPLQKVCVAAADTFSPELASVMWEEFFRRIRRTNTTPTGDVDRRLVPEECGFVWHLADRCLGDNGGLDHDWLEYVPGSVRANPGRKVPLLLFSHGMSDNPLKAADMSKIHEIGEREGFITVYPFSGDRFKWNLNLDAGLHDDVAYYSALIAYLKRTYPIDETRVYLSGFSNGAGMAMTFALCHPELIAAICPVDSTFPYANMSAFRPARPEPFLTPVLKPGETAPQPFMPRENPEKNMAPLRAALARQEARAFRMPVMYFYGTRESEYPIGASCNQQLQYDFWKAFNNIPVKPSVDGLLPDAVGVAGDKVRVFFPSAEHPQHQYTEHVFFSRDGGQDYYHFLLMHGKAHEVHPIERELGWAYVRRFSRNSDGSLNDQQSQA